MGGGERDKKGRKQIGSQIQLATNLMGGRMGLGEGEMRGEENGQAISYKS